MVEQPSFSSTRCLAVKSTSLVLPVRRKRVPIVTHRPYSDNTRNSINKLSNQIIDCFDTWILFNRKSPLYIYHVNEKTLLKKKCFLVPKGIHVLIKSWVRCYNTRSLRNSHQGTGILPLYYGMYRVHHEEWGSVGDEEDRWTREGEREGRGCRDYSCWSV